MLPSKLFTLLFPSIIKVRALEALVWRRLKNSARFSAVPCKSAVKTGFSVLQAPRAPARPSEGHRFGIKPDTVSGGRKILRGSTDEINVSGDKLRARKVEFLLAQHECRCFCIFTAVNSFISVQHFATLFRCDSRKTSLW